MHRWAEHFSAKGIASAQILLTHADLRDRERLNNAREALLALLESAAVPVINENDTVATDEIRFGDNDQLSSMVVPLIGADLLLLLTDVDGILDQKNKRLRVMNDTSQIAALSPKNALGSGGISSKIEAARRATRSGAAAVVASALGDEVIKRVLSGEDIGTLFEPHVSKLKARKHWIAYTLRPRGVVVVDPGAARALRSGNTSLLPVGVIGIRGTFNAGDSVQLVSIDGTEVGRGLTRMGALEAARAAGKSTAELKPLLPHHGAQPLVVHKDDLVVTE
jgi:glutamate 5-kinase